MIVGMVREAMSNVSRLKGLRLKLMLVAAVTLVAGASAAAWAQAPAQTPSPAAGAQSGNYPLGAVVPAEKYVTLAEGRVRTLRWGVYAFRGKGSRSGRPCLAEVDQFVDGGLSRGTECGALAPPADWPVFTLFRFTLDEGRGDKSRGGSVIGMTFGTQIRRVVVDLGPGPNLSRSTRLVPVARAKKANLGPFRYLAFAIGRSACVEGVTGFSASNEKVLDTTRYDCTGPEIELPGDDR
jgi:hypothetical protein